MSKINHSNQQEAPMKDLSFTIGRPVEPMYGLEPIRYYVALPIARLIEEQVWNRIDHFITEPYYDIREITIERLEQLKGKKRPEIDIP